VRTRPLVEPEAGASESKQRERVVTLSRFFNRPADFAGVLGLIFLGAWIALSFCRSELPEVVQQSVVVTPRIPGAAPAGDRPKPVATPARRTDKRRGSCLPVAPGDKDGRMTPP